jgi:hypothetical protein
MTSCLNYTSCSQFQSTRGGTGELNEREKTMAANIEKVTIHQAKSDKT